jgi:hypothetical protein
MKVRSRVAIAVSALIAVGTLSAGVANAAASTKEVRQSDFVPSLSGTRPSGHFEFLKDGSRLYTDDSTSDAKVAEYFAVNKPLAGMTDVSYDWFGTAPAPGQHHVVDTDGDTSTPEYNILVGEKVYGGTDVWLTNGSTSAMKQKAPSCDGTPEAVTDPANHCTSGFGSY